MTEASPRLLLDLARMMIKQAKILREAGLAEEARNLARKAIMFDAAGWQARTLDPVPVRTETRRSVRR